MENKEAKNNQSEQKEEKRIQKNEDSINSLWDNFKRSNICIIAMPEGEEKEQEFGNLSEKIVKGNVLNSVGKIDIQVQEAQRVPIMMDAKRPTLRHIIINRPNVKETLKSSKRKEVSYQMVAR